MGGAVQGLTLLFFSNLDAPTSVLVEDSEEKAPQTQSIQESLEQATGC